MDRLCSCRMILKRMLQLIVHLLDNVILDLIQKEKRGKRERERERETIASSIKRVRSAIVQSKIKMTGYMIYGIDLNLEFKLRSIIQSQSFSFLFFHLFVLFTWCWFLLLTFIYPLKVGSILNIYLGISVPLHTTWLYILKDICISWIVNSFKVFVDTHHVFVDRDILSHIFPPVRRLKDFTLHFHPRGYSWHVNLLSCIIKIGQIFN